MPKRKFRLERQGPERLLLSWRGIWKDIQVTLDGQPLGEPIPNFAALKAGRDFELPDGATLHVQFRKGGLGSQAVLEVTRDGQPLPGSDADPRSQVKLAAGVTWFIAAMSTALGVLGMSGVGVVATMGFDWPSVAAGVVFGALGYFVLRRSRIALALVVALFALDTVLTLVAGLEPGVRIPIGAVVFRIVIFLPLFQGFKAMTAADAYDRRDQAVDAF